MNTADTVTIKLTVGELAALVDGTPSVYNALQTDAARKACAHRVASDWDGITSKLAGALDAVGPVETREFEVIPGRRYLKVAEWLGSREHGQRTMRWFVDKTDDVIYVAESWTKPNLCHRLNAEQRAYVRSIVPGL